MRNLDEFLTFKIEKCEEPLCPCYIKMEPHSLPRDYAECSFFHNNQDKRRKPVLSDGITPAYEYAKPDDTFLDNRKCINMVEYLFHPLGFKTIPCVSCLGFYCPYYHNKDDRDFWRIIRERFVQKKQQKIEEKQESSLLFQKLMARNYDSYSNLSLNQSKATQDDWTENGKTFQKEQTLDHSVSGIFSSVNQSQIQEFSKDQARIEREENNNILKTGLIDGFNIEGYQGAYFYEEGNADQKFPFVPTFFRSSSDESRENREEEKKENVNANMNGVHQEEKRIPESTNNNVTPLQESENVLYFPTNELPKEFYVQNIEAQNLPENMTYGSKFYNYGDSIGVQEDMYHEFKYFKGFQIPYIEDLVQKYVCGFLNSQGGTLYLGITDDGIVKGIRSNRKILDDISVTLDRKLKGFYPPVRADQYSLKANPVIDRRTNAYMRDLHVIEIEIKNGDPCELYFADNKDCFIRKQASSIILNPVSIKEEIKIRTKRQMAKNLVGLLSDHGFDESLRRQSVRDLEQIKMNLEKKIKLINELIQQDQGHYDKLLQHLEKGID